MYSTVLNCTQLYSTVLNGTQLYPTVLNCTQRGSTVPNCTQLYSTVHNCTQLSDANEWGSEGWLKWGLRDDRSEELGDDGTEWGRIWGIFGVTNRVIIWVRWREMMEKEEEEWREETEKVKLKGERSGGELEGWDVDVMTRTP
jgi:hypothetical protein